MINFDYFIESMEFFYETYPKLRHTLKYPESMADTIHIKDKDSLYINAYVATSVGKYYNTDPNDGLYRILKHNELVKYKKEIYQPQPHTYRIYSTDNKLGGLVENKRFIEKKLFGYTDNGNLHKTIFKITDTKEAGYIITDYNNFITDIYIEPKYRRTNLLHEMLKISEGVITNKGEIEDEIIKSIFNEIKNKKGCTYAN